MCEFVSLCMHVGLIIWGFIHLGIFALIFVFVSIIAFSMGWTKLGLIHLYLLIQ